MSSSSSWLPDEQRVVVTGIGARTPNGLDMPTTWDQVCRGKSGIARIKGFDTTDFGVKIAGEVRGFDPVALMGAKNARRADRYVQLAIAATLEALGASGLTIDDSNRDEVGVFVGNGAGGIETYMSQWSKLNERGPRALSPMLIPMIVTDSGSVQIAIMLQVRGPSLGISSACSTGLDAVGLALETIRRGDAQVMIAGGAEAPVNALGIGGFDRMGALSRSNDDPRGAARPFDSGRSGFVLSEGSVVMVLESLAHARARSAQPIAELRSYASTTDARHPTAPDETGESAVRCMRRALGKARVDPQEVDYICAHAPGTPLGDPIEVRAIRTVLGERAPFVPVSAPKSVTGHLMGAAGALSLALTACALRDGYLPPTTNLTDPDPACDLMHVANLGKHTDAQHALVPAYGFGGHNTCVVASRWTE
jgi:beta-ketoacyl-acyl-carrier-protein synthase II